MLYCYAVDVCRGGLKSEGSIVYGACGEAATLAKSAEW